MRDGMLLQPERLPKDFRSAFYQSYYGVNVAEPWIPQHLPHLLPLCVQLFWGEYLCYLEAAVDQINDDDMP